MEWHWTEQLFACFILGIWLCHVICPVLASSWLDTLCELIPAESGVYSRNIFWAYQVSISASQAYTSSWKQAGDTRSSCKRRVKGLFLSHTLGCWYDLQIAMWLDNPSIMQIQKLSHLRQLVLFSGIFQEQAQSRSNLHVEISKGCLSSHCTCTYALQWWSDVECWALSAPGYAWPGNWHKHEVQSKPRILSTRPMSSLHAIHKRFHQEAIMGGIRHCNWILCLTLFETGAVLVG